MDYVNNTMLEEILHYYYPNQSRDSYKTKIKNVGKKKISYSKVIQLVRETETIDQLFHDL